MAEIEERQRIQEIDDRYQAELHKIRLTVIDPVQRNAAIRQLEERRTNGYIKAWLEKEVKIHAAQVKSGEYNR